MQNYLTSSRSFRKEFRKQIRLAVVAAIGFTIAFAWRNAIFDSFQDALVRFLDVQKYHFLTEIYTALAITIVGVSLILVTSKFLKE
jgi:hypothetical protein